MQHGRQRDPHRLTRTMQEEDLWAQCVRWLEGELPDRDVHTWIRPLQPVFVRDRLNLLAPNRMVVDRVRQDYLELIRRSVKVSGGRDINEVEVAVGAVEPGRSEEHTSELQSLMRISYAVFCLKKKKHTHKLNTLPTPNNYTVHIS